ncbi:AP2 domain-containing protein (modular protein) [Candidatus Desulfosporosinus infrequens]|uniref:AP2 domain-containing protein (Modular protein) n=1 Tax=Candidatus Desulfosporosinus infrequens TaxID=2043169 RepID=A0A2U3LUU2_9FIRM|nr:AP2 domain-containing protein (modular protein) [Candidatus Desulfosporosinus infrequens]
MSRKRDLEGREFGSLTIIAEAGRGKSGDTLWQCKCNCGKEIIATGSNIALGKTQSCGSCYSNSYRLSEDGNYMIGAFPNGKMFMFDLDDCQKVLSHTWHLDNKGYVFACIDHKLTRMHRYLMNAPDGLDIDHIKGVRTDNRKSNLRFATQTENRRNKRVRKDSISGVKGVYYDKRFNKYRAGIRIDGRQIHLGYYSTLLKASESYDQAAIHYFGEFAWLNNLREKTPPMLFCPSPKTYHGEILNTLSMLV